MSTPPYTNVIDVNNVLQNLVPIIVDRKNQQNYYNNDDSRRYITTTGDRALKGLESNVSHEEIKFDVNKFYPYFDNKVITYTDIKNDERINVTQYRMDLVKDSIIVGYKPPGHNKWYDLNNWENWKNLEGGFRRKSFKKTRRQKNKNKKNKSRRSR
jgi:hypothetical protein